VRAVVTLVVLYCVALSIVVFLFRQLPPLEVLAARREAASVDSNAVELRLAIPHSFDEVRQVRATLEAYRLEYGRQVAVLLSTTYVFLQTFMMPGAMAINILMGSMYPLPAALGFSAAISTVGASLNY
jgi:hypothetical protein